MVEHKKYLELAIDAARQAGGLLKRRLGRIKSIAYKGRMNLVTDVDIKSEALIVSRLRKACPGHNILTEEKGGVIAAGTRFSWLIDPLDGTTNYAHSFPFFAVSIALLEWKKPVVGVVYDPMRDELFYASRSQGAFLNRKSIRVTQTKSLGQSLLATGFPYQFGRAMKRNVDNFSAFMLKAQAVRRAGSAALDLCYVACGRFDGFWELDLHPWDTAAGVIIAEEAQGKVTTFSGREFDPFKREIVCSNSAIHDKMLKTLR